MSVNRNAKYDNIKFFLICCVVLGHLGNYFSSSSNVVGAAQFWIYLFHMPAFIFIAGLFAKKRINENNWKKIVPFLLIYILMEILQFGVRMVSGAKDNTLDILHETNVPWYALAMFWWYLLTLLLRKVKPGYVLSLSLALAVASGYCDKVGSFLVIQRTLIFYPFFYAGYILNPEKLLKQLNRPLAKGIGAAVIVASIALTFSCYNSISAYRILFRARASYSAMFEGVAFQFGWLWRMAAYVVSVLLTVSVMAVIPNVHCRLFSYIGRNTLSVFVFHWSCYTLMLQLIPGFYRFIKTNCTPVLCLIFCFCIVAVLALPVFSWPINKIMTVFERLPKKKNEVT